MLTRQRKDWLPKPWQRLLADNVEFCKPLDENTRKVTFFSLEVKSKMALAFAKSKNPNQKLHETKKKLVKTLVVYLRSSQLNL